jgi:hypothetical protein
MVPGTIREPSGTMGTIGILGVCEIGFKVTLFGKFGFDGSRELGTIGNHHKHGKNRNS